MAKKLRFNYTFTPSTNTIVIDGNTSGKRLLLITNLTTNTIIYNFADPTKSFSSVTYNSTTNQTTIILTYSTLTMSSTDALQIFTEEDAVEIRPTEPLYDPVNKFRTSQPQALIDTDFEYGTQISKWENLAMVNNRPFAFPSAVGLGTIVNYISIPSNSKTVTVGLSTAAPGVGTAIVVQDTFFSGANGTFLIDTVSGTGNTVFTYTARTAGVSLASTQIFDSNKTGIFSGTTYTGAAIGGTPTFAGGTAGLAVTVTTTVPHGLSLGNNVVVQGTTQANANGTFPVVTILNSTQFVYYTNTAPAATPTGGQIFVRPPGAFLHRPFDGGVLFSSNATSNYETATRQTRRYFRYQSGKGIQVSTGTLLKPNLQIETLTATGVGIGSTINVQTKEQHNIQAAVPGTQVSIFGANETGYNGTYTVSSVTGYNKFQVTAAAGLGTTVASGNYNLSVTSWYGCANRAGVYDQQNGLFFEFDGQTLYAVRRNSTYQISGRVSATNGSNTITQTDAAFPTAFTKQLAIGDFIVIRGQSYRIADIASDTSLTITPSYRGTTTSYVTVSKTIDTKIAQSSWNLDKCDGTGPSGYSIDLSKMQMWYIDFSWYGAGFVRWGVRGTDGNVIYVHKLINNNVNTEAYMRSGNLPARYESTAQPPITVLNKTISNTDTYIGIGSTAGFPPSGTVVVRNADSYEYMNYTGIGTTALTGVNRAKSGNLSLALTNISAGQNVATATTTNLQVGQRIVGAAGTAFPDGTYIASIGTGTITLSQAANTGISNPTVIAAPMGVGIGTTFTYSATDPVAVELAYPTYGPSISHWGTSAIMDGRFDDDKSLVFTYGQTTQTSITTGTSKALFSIRVAPSVDNGIAAGFGARELINRMQLTLKTLDISIAGIQTANVLVRAYLNSTPSSATPWTNAVGGAQGIINSSLAQIADYAGGTTTVAGGEVTAGFWVSGTGSVDLSNVRDLGNSILGGGGANANTQIYPDGPDVLTIVATNFTPGTTVNLQGRISWTEAQA
jgi:hypothetical protein